MKLVFPFASWTSLASFSLLAFSVIVARADDRSGRHAGATWTRSVAAANPRTDHPDNRIAPGFYLEVVAQGLEPLENPSGKITHFGYLSDADEHPVEPTKTEPDENTYLVLDHNPGGPDTGYDYGRHFLFQGHEAAGGLAYITRINLDVANPDRHITLLTPVGPDGKTGLNAIDGSTWNPFTRTLLFTQEAGGNGGVIELSPEFGSEARTLYGVLGRGGYEGIHPDGAGNLYIVEDAGGTAVNVNPNDPASPKKARVPNSYVYRFVPKQRTNLAAGGVLQALRVMVGGAPLTYVPVDAAHPTGDAFSAAQLELHTVGRSWPASWITVHDTDRDGFAEFNANLAARAAGATPFKRPENGAFQPGSDFRRFYFDVTGDTDVAAGQVPALAARGAWGGIFRLDLGVRGEAVAVTLVVLGDATHAAFDNLTFARHDVLLAAEDRGDTLHRQLNTLDSIWAFDLGGSRIGVTRFLALGRDRESEADVALGEANTPGFQNDGDNEPTGLHVSDGDDSVAGLNGRRRPSEDSLMFFTQQHGENNVFMVIPARPRHE